MKCVQRSRVSFLFDSPLLASIVICLVFLAIQFTSGRTIFTDDPFVSFRYARNLATGNGLVFNIGERVEGYSNFLWVILLAGSVRAGFDIVATSKIFGITFNLLTVILVLIVSRRIHRSSPFWLLSPCLLITGMSFIRWGGGGLETPMFTFLVTGAFTYPFAMFSGHWPDTSGQVRVYAPPDTGLMDFRSRRVNWSGIFSGLCAALAALTRPEGFWIGPALAGLSAWSIRRHREQSEHGTTIGRFGTPLTQLLIWVIVVVPFFVWRYVYYADIFPNTFYCKLSFNRIVWAQGIGYLINFFYCHGHLFLLAGLLAAWPAFSDRWRSIPVMISIHCLCILVMGGDWMPYHRFMVPILPVLLLVCGIGYRHGLLRFPYRLRSGIMIIVLAGISLQPLYPEIAGVSNLVRQIEQIVSGKTQLEGTITTILGTQIAGSEGWIDSQRRFGLWLKYNTPPESVIALGAAGIIPYYSERKTIDFFGKISRDIARSNSRSGWRLPGHQKYDRDLILAARPDLIILSGQINPEKEPVFWLKRFGFWDNEDFRDHYEYRVIDIKGMKQGFYLKKTASTVPIPTAPDQNKPWHNESGLSESD